MEWSSQKKKTYTGELAKNGGGAWTLYTFIGGGGAWQKGGVEGGDTPMHTVGTDNMGTFTR